MPGCFLLNRVSTNKVEQDASLQQQEHDSYAYAALKGFHVVHNFRVQETASKDESRHVFMAVGCVASQKRIDKC